MKNLCGILLFFENVVLKYFFCWQTYISNHSEQFFSLAILRSPELRIRIQRIRIIFHGSGSRSEPHFPHPSSPTSKLHLSPLFPYTSSLTSPPSSLLPNLTSRISPPSPLLTLDPDPDPHSEKLPDPDSDPHKICNWGSTALIYS